MSELTENPGLIAREIFEALFTHSHRFERAKDMIEHYQSLYRAKSPKAAWAESEAHVAIQIRYIWKERNDDKQRKLEDQKFRHLHEYRDNPPFGWETWYFDLD